MPQVPRTPTTPGQASPERVVLIANSQEWASRSLESVLGPAGYTVVRAFNPRDTMRAVHERRIDAVIVDASLGDEEMLALCRELRADPQVRDSTAILVTTAGPLTRPQALAVLRAGGSGAWSEPLDPEEFLLRLDGYVRAKLDADRGVSAGKSAPPRA